MRSRRINSSTHGYKWLVNHVSISTGWSTTETRRVLKAVVEVIGGALAAGDVVELKGFGKFWVVGTGRGKTLRFKLWSGALRRLWSVVDLTQN